MSREISDLYRNILKKYRYGLSFLCLVNIYTKCLSAICVLFVAHFEYYNSLDCLHKG